jgi:hypothetical protein
MNKIDDELKSLADQVVVYILMMIHWTFGTQAHTSTYVCSYCNTVKPHLTEHIVVWSPI